jgi:hypothetical protein
VLHSKNDRIINFKHAKQLEDTRLCTLTEIKGGHNDPNFNNQLNKIMNDLNVAVT